MMKQFLNILSVLIVLIAGMTNACAGPWWRNRDDGGQRERQQTQRQDRYNSNQYQYQQSQRAPEDNQESRRHRSTMTPEERRVLRQQIQDAGREVYPPNR